MRTREGEREEKYEIDAMCEEEDIRWRGHF
jgi:hypothetical protein